MLKRMAELRKEKGVSQEKLGELLGVKKQTISAYENGLASPNTDALVKLADYFKVSVDFLLERTNVRNPLDDPSVALFTQNITAEEFKAIEAMLAAIRTNKN